MNRAASEGMAPSSGRSIVRRWLLLGAIIALALEAARLRMAAPTPPAELTPVQVRLVLSMSPVLAPPPDPTNRLADSPAAAAFGEAVFFDAGFSADGTVSCATCHVPALAFSDGLAVAKGLGTGKRNTPTIIDSAHQRWFTWDGRADSMWAQALHPFLSPVEMGITASDVVQRVRTVPALAAGYRAASGHDLSTDPEDTAFATIGKCLAAYERTVASGRSPFDEYVDALRSGDQDAASTYPIAAQRGLALFVGRGGCIRCHSSPVLSDGEFHLVGVPDAAGVLPQDVGRFQAIGVVQSDPFNAAGSHSDAPNGDQARLTRALLKQPELWGAVRTPSLRTAWGTAPYMHAGQFQTLGEVVHFYNTLEGAVALDHHAERMLAPLGLTADEEAELVAFLESLQPTAGR